MLVLSEEDVMLRDAARGFLDEHAPVAALRTLRDTRDPNGFSRDLWLKMAEMGWTGILVPEAHGGLDYGHTGAALICEEMGRSLTASPFLSTAVMATTALSRGGTPAQQDKWLPAIASGRALISVAIDEGRKHAPLQTALKAEPSGNGFRLDGQKTFVADGHIADAFIVVARTDGVAGDKGGLSLFLVDAKAPGVGVERTIMVDSRNAARVAFEGVQIDAADALGAIGDAHGLLETMLCAGRTGLAAELSGVAQESFARTLSYLKDRQQFGKPIGAFQALQHRAAELYCEIELVKSTVLAAARMLDTDPTKAGPLVSVAKAKASDVARRAVSEAVQMHGGIGMTDAIDIGLFMKRARAAIEMLGDANFHAEEIASLRGF